jgi:uridine kinase
MPDMKLSFIRDLLAGGIPGAVRTVECDYEEKVRSVARRLISDPDRRVLLLAGPSSSGKTTTSRLLCEELRESGHEATVLSLDDFYRNPEEPEYPRDREGKLDYEAPDSIDIALVHDCIEAVLEGHTYPAPRFDFLTHRRAPAPQPISVPEGGVLIIEGLHALNPRLAAGLPQNRLFRLFISVSTNITDGESGARLFSGRRVRFLRRLSRDALYRNSGAANTYTLWKNVTRGESLFLYPYRDTADMTLDTFHPYEIGVLRPYAERLLAAENAPHDDYIDEIRASLAHFAPLPTEIVPGTSLLREFLPSAEK